MKDQLCQELNLVVQESAHAQVNKLEQLTARLEQLGGGIVGGTPGANNLLALKATVTADAAAATAEAAAAVASTSDDSAGQEQPKAEGDAPKAETAAPSVPAAGPDAVPKAGKKAKKPVRSKQAEDARQRHVALPSDTAASHRRKSAERPQQLRDAGKQPVRDDSNPFLTNEEANQRRTNPFPRSSRYPIRWL